MSELAWVLTITVGAAALVGAVWNVLIRNTLVAILLSTCSSFLLWWYFTARTDPFWPIAALTVVPIIVTVSIVMGMLGRAARKASSGPD